MSHEDNGWMAEQDRDEKCFMVDVERVIEAAAIRPLQPDEQRLLAWASGTHPEIRA